MKYSSLLLKDQSNGRLSSLRMAPFPGGSLAPLDRRSSDSVAATNSSLYHLVAKRKLTPEYPNPRAAVGPDEGSYWGSKRTRLDAETFGRDHSAAPVRIQERIPAGASSRSFPFFPVEREAAPQTRRYDAPPPLEPIAAASSVVKKDLGRALLSTVATREQRDSFSREFPTRHLQLRDGPTYSAAAAAASVVDFRRDELHQHHHNHHHHHQQQQQQQARRRMSFTASIPPDDSRAAAAAPNVAASVAPVADDADRTAYYGLYRKMAAGHDVPRMPQTTTGGDRFLNPAGLEIGPSRKESPAAVGPGPGARYKRAEYSYTLHEYQKEFRKYSERDKFHENVDQILRTHKQQGLPLTSDYIKKILPAEQTRGREPAHQRIDGPGNGGGSAHGGSSWPNLRESGQPARKSRQAARQNDENRFREPLSSSSSTSSSSSSSAIITLAMRRIGRGRFGVLECLNNFAHRMYQVERSHWKCAWNAHRPEAKDLTTSGRRYSSNNSNYNNNNDNDIDSLPLDLTKSVSSERGSRQEDDCSRGSSSEVAAAAVVIVAAAAAAAATPAAATGTTEATESARLPIKKRMAKYCSLTDDEKSTQKVVGIEGGTSEIDDGLVNIRVNSSYNDNVTTTCCNKSYSDSDKNNNKDDEGKYQQIADPASDDGPESEGRDVTLEKRLKSLIETADEDGNLPLHLAVMKEDVGLTSALVREMTLRNMSLDRYNRSKQTPIHLATKRGNVDLVRILLAGLSSCNIPDSDGNTCLHLALGVEDLEVFKSVCLMSRVPIDVASVNRDGLTAEDMARKRGLPSEYLELLRPSRRGAIKSMVADERCPSGEDVTGKTSPTSGTIVSGSNRPDSAGRTSTAISSTFSSSSSPSPSSASTTAAARATSATFLLTPSSSPFSNHSSSPTLDSIPPLLSPCRLNSPPLSPSSTSSSSMQPLMQSVSPLKQMQSMSPPTLSTPFGTLEPSRSCLSLTTSKTFLPPKSQQQQQQQQQQSSPSSSYVDKYGGGGGSGAAQLSLYAAC